FVDEGEDWSELRAYDSSLPVITGGTVSPISTVSAPPKTVYVDTAISDGALVYVKKSGTGTSGWKKMVDLENSYTALRLAISGSLSSGADQTGDFVIPCPFAFTATKMVVVSKTNVSTAM